MRKLVAICVVAAATILAFVIFINGAGLVWLALALALAAGLVVWALWRLATVKYELFP
jgi:hypothetical protein